MSDEAGEPTQGTPSSKGGCRDTEPREGTTPRSSSSESVSLKLTRIAQLARRHRGEALTTLFHHIDMGLLREAYARTRKDGAVGVDGQTAEEYASNLDENLADLLERFRSGAYHAPPVRRVHIPKGDGLKTRPIGIPTFEDKILQRSVAMVLEAVYEEDFRPCSFGFRPGRSPHQALDALWHGTMGMVGSVVLDVDIQAFFDSLDHGHLRGFLDQRVRDGVIRRTIDKWLKAGVLEDGRMTRPDEGTPQGGVISPLLANIYLHHVLDTWFEDEIKRRLRGRAVLIRYADDFVIAFENREDAERVMAVLPSRLGRYALKLHPEKTRVVPFRRPPPVPKGRGDDDVGPTPPGTFDFLGFTHYWGKSRKGRFVVKRKTSASRLRRTLAKLSTFCRRARHREVREQHEALSRKLRGHDAYYGITGNARALSMLREKLKRIWRYWLARRSERRTMSWEHFAQILTRYPLPRPVVVHSALRSAARP